MISASHCVCCLQHSRQKYKFWLMRSVTTGIWWYHPKRVTFLWCTKTIVSSSARSLRCYVHLQLSSFHLLAVMDGENIMDTISFRWNEQYTFWHIHTTKGAETCTPLSDTNLHAANWRMLIYCRTRSLNELDESISLNLNGQRPMRCDLHDNWLVKQPVTCDMSCCVQDCTRNATWLCTGGQTCCHALCYAHGMDLISSEKVINVSNNMSGTRLKRTHVTPSRESLTHEEPSQLDSEFSECYCQEQESGVLAPIGSFVCLFYA